MAATETFMPGRLYEMPLADLQPDPNQPRKYIDPAALDELTASIQQQGVVSPILFRVENGIACVIAGERRCKNPSSPKHVLIEIAVKKQERSMLKAYDAYKASVNPEKKVKTGETMT